MNTALDPKTRHRLDVQGYRDIDDAQLAPFGSWMRMAFVGCAGLAALGTAAASPTALLGLAVVALVAAVSPVHPFDLIYNHGIRHLRGTGPLPRRPLQTRFSCGMGALHLMGTAHAFASGDIVVGYALGAVLVFVAGLVATTDICIPSMLMETFYFGPRRRRAPAASASSAV